MVCQPGLRSNIPPTFFTGLPPQALAIAPTQPPGSLALERRFSRGTLGIAA